MEGFVEVGRWRCGRGGFIRRSERVGSKYGIMTLRFILQKMLENKKWLLYIIEKVLPE